MWYMHVACVIMYMQKYHMQTYINEINFKYIQLNNYKIDNQTYFAITEYSIAIQLKRLKFY